MAVLRPYLAAFAARFQLTLQYRTAALAGFATQCWWGAIKIMILAAFFAGSATSQPISLEHAVTYTWLGQAFLIFLPWNADPDIAEMVRTGAVAYERLRPVDTYGWWYVRAVARTTAQVAPRAGLMFTFATVLLPLAGLRRWSLPPPSGLEAGLLFAASMAAVALLSAAIVSLINIVVVASLNERGANLLFAPLVNLLSGGIVPLAFFPDWARGWLRAQPLAGLIDAPFRVYFGELAGGRAMLTIAGQLAWALAVAFLGRWWLGRVMRRLQVQGG
jgi:ABC-2 type transport system permease protein